MGFLANYNRKTQKQGNFTFKEGIETFNLSSSKGATFRVLPAFDPESDDPLSWMPAFDPLPDGTNVESDWAHTIYVSAFFGHGQNTKSLLSPQSFDVEAPCPIEDLVAYIKANKNDWGHLMEDMSEKGGERRVVQKVAPQLVMNVIDFNATHKYGLLGVMASRSAKESLIALFTTRNTNPKIVAAAEAAGDPSMLYANGDITHPGTGNVLVCRKDENSKGNYTSYVVELLEGVDSRTRQRTQKTMEVPDEHMQNRIRLDDPESYLNRREYGDIVGDMVTLLNVRSPNGLHEHDMLREVFPDYADIIPLAPTAPAARPTVSAYVPAKEEPAKAAPAQAGTSKWSRPKAAAAPAPEPEPDPEIEDTSDEGQGDEPSPEGGADEPASVEQVSTPSSLIKKYAGKNK